MNLQQQWTILKHLLIADLRLFSKVFVDRFINMTIWATLTIVVSGYLLMAFGVKQDFVTDIRFVGVCSMVGLFYIFPNAALLLADLEGDKAISYFLMLPTSSILIFARFIILYFITSGLMSLLLLPLGQLLLWGHFSLLNINFFYYALIFFLSQLFFGCFSLWITTRIPSFDQIENIWMRFIFPCWMLGGSEFSWHVLRDKMPILAYVDLLNPLIYITEGNRSALMNISTGIPFWICCLALLGFSFLFAWSGITRMKKRLDCL